MHMPARTADRETVADAAAASAADAAARRAVRARRSAVRALGSVALALSVSAAGRANWPSAIIALTSAVIATAANTGNTPGMWQLIAFGATKVASQSPTGVFLAAAGIAAGAFAASIAAAVVDRWTIAALGAAVVFVDGDLATTALTVAAILYVGAALTEMGAVARVGTAATAVASAMAARIAAGPPAWLVDAAVAADVWRGRAARAAGAWLAGFPGGPGAGASEHPVRVAGDAWFAVAEPGPSGRVAAWALSSDPAPSAAEFAAARRAGGGNPGRFRFVTETDDGDEVRAVVELVPHDSGRTAVHIRASAGDSPTTFAQATARIGMRGIQPEWLAELATRAIVQEQLAVAAGGDASTAADPRSTCDWPGRTAQTPDDTIAQHQTPDDTIAQHQTPDDTAHQTPDDTIAQHQTPDDTAHQTPDDTAHQTPDDTIAQHQTPDDTIAQHQTPDDVVAHQLGDVALADIMAVAEKMSVSVAAMIIAAAFEGSVSDALADMIADQ